MAVPVDPKPFGAERAERTIIMDDILNSENKAADNVPDDLRDIPYNVFEPEPAGAVPEPAWEALQTGDAYRSAEPFRSAEQTESFHSAAPDRDEVISAYSLEKLKNQYKAEKKAYKKALKEERKQEYASGTRKRFSVGLTVLISVISCLICIALIFTALLYFPTKDKSLFSTLVKKYSDRYTVRTGVSSSVKIGDSEIDPSSNVNITVDGEFSVSAAYAKASPSVVAIECVTVGIDGSETTETMGSGIIVSEDGEIMTNCHLFTSLIDTTTGKFITNSKLYVYIDDPYGEPYETTNLLGYDIDFDIALIKLDCTGLKPITFADSDELTPGQKVVAIGSPGGLEFMNSVCDGVISGTKRSTTSESGALLYDMIQMTAPINPGNSGGAVVNSEGELVGISQMKIVADYYENMTFAISSNMAGRIIESFRKYGRFVQPVLGIVVNTLYGWKDAKDNSWPLGSYVTEVVEGGSCYNGGVKAGDIVCGINGEEVYDFVTLKTNLLKCDPDDEIELRIFRTEDGQYYDLKVKLNAS